MAGIKNEAENGTKSRARSKAETPAEVIEKRLEGARFSRELADTIVRIAFVALIAWILLTKAFLITQAHGQGMFPAVKDGDLVIAYRLEQKYQKNDILIVEVDGKNYIGRLAANETDVIYMDDTGSMTVNGTVQGGEIIYPTYARPNAEYPLRIPEGYVYLLGDYRTEAEDCRDFGPVPISAVKGKVITILRRREL